MNELDLLRRLTHDLAGHAAVLVGAGDDCAVLDLGLPDLLLLFKTDAVVEGIHFLPGTPPEKIGWKALARCLSDIAAMGGTPTAALVTLGLPPGFDAARIERIYAGLNDCARRYGVGIAGGETTTNPGALLLSLALLGTVPKARCLRRRGAQVGDALFVTGELGGSLAGRHLDFEPRLAEARWLAEHFAIHAMIDLSDGLASDLRHVLEASGVGAEVHGSLLPVSRAAKRAGREKPSAKPPVLAALTDGEDFELLFTVASRDAVPLRDAWQRQFPALKLSCIGRIIAGDQALLLGVPGVTTLPTHGYVHFAKS